MVNSNTHLNGEMSIKAVEKTSLKAFLKNNLSNGSFMIFAFSEVTDNPFVMESGFCLATYLSWYGTAARLVAFNEGAIEAKILNLDV